MPAYRSRLEEKLARWFELNGHQFEYETLKLNYTLSANYYPDFILPNGVILEAKGYFKPEDRRKMLAVKKQHPNLDIRLVFQAPYNTLTKKSQTTYAKWAEKNGFLWAASHAIPLDWFDALSNGNTKN
jgi:hypothetical protein